MKVLVLIILIFALLVSIPPIIQLEVYLFNGGSVSYYLAMFGLLSLVPLYCFVFYKLLRGLILCLKS